MGNSRVIKRLGLNRESLDSELLRYLEFLLWHRRTCSIQNVCKTCRSADGLRAQIMAQIFSTVIYDQQKIGVRNGTASRRRVSDDDL
jgi:hypothetical protein